MYGTMKAMANVPRINPAKALKAVPQARAAAATLAAAVGPAAARGAKRLGAEAAVGKVVEMAISPDGQQWLKSHAPRSRRQILEHRVGLTVQQTSEALDGGGLNAEQEAQFSDWRDRARRLHYRLGIEVARGGRKDHLALIQSDLDALQAEMNAALR